MILNKKIQNQTSKQAKKHTTKQEFKKCKMNKKKMKWLMRVPKRTDLCKNEQHPRSVRTNVLKLKNVKGYSII